MDSDLTNDPGDIPKFVAQMERDVDVIKASRFIEGGGMAGVPWQRAIFSRSGNWVARALFRVGLRDCTNGFRAVKVAILTRMDLREAGFPVIVEGVGKTRQRRWFGSLAHSLKCRPRQSMARDVEATSARLPLATQQ